MPSMPSVIQKLKDTSKNQLSEEPTVAGTTSGTAQASSEQPRKSSFDEDDKALLGFTGEKKKFSYGASGGPKTSLGISDDRHGTIASGPRANLSPKQKRDVAQAFEVFDVGGTGYMSTVDLRVALRALGFDATKNEMKKLCEIFDVGDTGRLCFADFMTIIEMKLGEDDTKEDIQKAFNLFDKDQVGYIAFHNLRQVALELGEDINDEEIAVRKKYDLK